MTTGADGGGNRNANRNEARLGRQRLALAVAGAVTVPAIVLRLGSSTPSPVLGAVLFGLAIVGSAFLLSWAAEVAQLDISAGLAIAVLAFIAVLPEYAVDLVFAWKGGKAVRAHGARCLAPGATGDSPCSLALANMTGANRLLIGVGWSLVVFVAWYQWRRRGTRLGSVELERQHSVELSYLTIATIYCLTLPLKRTVTLVDAAVLVAMFAAYTVRISRAPAEEPHLVGAGQYLGRLDPTRRRMAIGAMFVAAAGVIVLCAEPFADALVATGSDLGISEFLLVQWLAPLASEAPELLVAGLYAWRLNTGAGLGTLVSSKVNQWTLLVGTLPIVFAVASGTHHGLPIASRQREELLLTAAQSLFAVAILTDLAISVREAAALLTLFASQFVIGAVLPESAHGAELVIVSVVYVLGAGVVVVRQRPGLRQRFRDGLRAPYAELGRP